MARLAKARKELHQFDADLADIAEPLDQAANEEAPVPLDIFHMKTIISQLDTLRPKISDSLSTLLRNETSEDAISIDQQNRARLFREWDRLKHLATSLMNTYEAEKIVSNITRAITRLEKKKAENPTTVYKESLIRVDSQMDELRAKLNCTTLPPGHHLWVTCEEFEDKIESMLSYESKPVDSKDFCKLHAKGPYKISDLVVPKFNGKIQQWIPFWEEFDHAVNKKADMDDSTKMVYLKQAILDPGLKQTIADLGIKDDAYTAAIKLLQDRFNKPRIMHRLCCESIKALSPNNNSRASLTEMADKLQHILTGLNRLESLLWLN